MPNDGFWLVESSIQFWQAHHPQPCGRYTRATRDGRPGYVYCYFTPGFNEIGYIGKAKDPESRNRQHAKHSWWWREAWPRVVWQVCCPQCAADLELYLIWTIKPAFNRDGIKISNDRYDRLVAWHPQAMREAARTLGLSA